MGVNGIQFNGIKKQYILKLELKITRVLFDK